MADPMDEMTRDAIQRGLQNQEAIELIKKHCAKARVERSPHMGYSMLEDFIDLPISGREMRCEHGKAASAVGLDLLSNAVSFYRKNCSGCAHREVQAIPNLRTVVDELDEHDRQAETRQAEADEKAAQRRRERAIGRAQAVESEGSGTRRMISLLDAIDSETDSDAGKELIELSRLKPELCTPVAAQVLLETAKEVKDYRIFTALRHFNLNGKLDQHQLLQVVLHALSTSSIRPAAQILCDLRSLIEPGQLIPTLPSVIALAAPLRDFPGTSNDYGEPLEVAAALELPALLDALSSALTGEDSGRRRTAAAASTKLIEQHPEVGQALVPALAEALSFPGALSIYWGDPRNDIVDALAVAFVLEPEKTAASLEIRAVSRDDAVRGALFGAFDSSIRHERRRSFGAPSAQRVALEVAFRRIGGDWGAEVQQDAARLIELASSWEKEIAAGFVDQIFGALIQIVTGSDASAESAIVTPPSEPYLAEMERQSDEIRRNGLITSMRESLGNLVEVAPREVATNVFSIIDGRAPASDSEKEMLGIAVRVLGDLGRRADLLPEVLPALWTALVHSEQLIRSYAIESWGSIASVEHRTLPSDLSELLPTLLTDPYVIVHKTAVRTLANGLEIPDAVQFQVVSSLSALAEHYKTSDSRLLMEILTVLWRESLRSPKPDVMREYALVLAESLDGYEKERFLERRIADGLSLPEFTPRLVEVCADARRAQSDHRDDRFLALLRDQPSPELESRTVEIVEAARNHLPGNSWETQKFVEILQRCGHWKLALELIDEMLTLFPDDRENEMRRAQLLRLKHLCGVQEALANRDTDSAKRCLESALSADANLRSISIDPLPWEV